LVYIYLSFRLKILETTLNWYRKICSNFLIIIIKN
jgi:hypothetical protein